MKKAALIFLGIVLILGDVLLVFPFVFPPFIDDWGLMRAVHDFSRNPSPQTEANLKAAKSHGFRMVMVFYGVVCVLIVLNTSVIVKILRVVRTKSDSDPRC